MSHSPVQQVGQSSDILPKDRHRTPHLIVLSVCLAILGGAVLLSPSESDGGYLTIGSLPVPDACVFKNLTGIPCPGCGLTRSMVAAAHGDMKWSLQYHRLGLLTLLYVLLQFVYRIGIIAAPAITVRILGPETYINRGLVGLAILFLLNWIFSLTF